MAMGIASTLQPDGVQFFGDFIYAHLGTGALKLHKHVYSIYSYTLRNCTVHGFSSASEDLRGPSWRGWSSSGVRA